MIRQTERIVRELLNIAVRKEASDLHISVNHHPTLRIKGKLVALSEIEKIEPETSKEIAFYLMSQSQKEIFLKEKEIDFSYVFEKNKRFRVNVFFQKENISCSLRLIPTEIKSIEELNLPNVLHSFAKANQGLVLIVGPSSHGKSTTLAALINEINKNSFKRIVTIEDPIEYVFRDEKSIIDQREVYRDTNSFRNALKSVFRQDPDVIVLGEMRDPETISTTITAAETGHLIFSTLHTNSASESINRIIDSFPANQQNQIRSQLAMSLLGIVSQRLLPRKGGGLIPACEIMISNSATANIIREGRIHQLGLVIETSSREGMINLNQSLLELIKKGEISVDSALSYSRRPSELKKMIPGQYKKI